MSRVKYCQALLLLLGCAAIVTAQSQKATRAPNLPPGSMQQAAITACMECHDSSIIVQQRLSRAAWTKEMDKMIKWGVVVNAKDRDVLIDYFSVNFGPDKPPYIAPQASAAKSRVEHPKQ